MEMKLEIPAIGILRGVDASFFGEVMQTSFESGLEAIEVTMNTENAAGIIERYRPLVPAGKWLGAGTVRNLDEAKKAANAGAMFFVTPNLDVSVIEFSIRQNIPVITGALTPTEIYTAWSAGADMIKIFPCASFGPGYLKDLSGPFEQIDLVAVGGVTLDNLTDYLDAGAKAVGVSSCLFGRDALLEKDINKLGKNVRQFVQKCESQHRISK